MDANQLLCCIDLRIRGTGIELETADIRWWWVGWRRKIATPCIAAVHWALKWYRETLSKQSRVGHSVRQSVRPSVCLSVRPSVRPPARMIECAYICLSLYKGMYVYNWVRLCLSVCICIRVCVCMIGCVCVSLNVCLCIRVCVYCYTTLSVASLYCLYGKARP